MKYNLSNNVAKVKLYAMDSNTYILLFWVSPFTKNS